MFARDSPVNLTHASVRPISRKHWIILAAATAGALVVEWLLFATSVRDYVLPNYPAHHDQTAYLIRAYQADAAIRDHGAWAAFAQRIQRGSATGFLLDYEAALGFRLIAPSRLGALSVLFAHYAVLQIAVGVLLTALTGSIAYGILGLALIASSGFAFVVPGGIFDFRIDTAATCAFGLAMVALLRSRSFLDAKWSIATGVAAAYMIALRHNTLVHWLAIAAVLFAFLLLAPACGLLSREQSTPRLRGLLMSLAVALALCGPFLWFGLDDFYAYYAGQFAERGPIRGALSGRDTLVHWLFYPYNVLVQHTGRTFFLTAFLGAACVFSMGRHTSTENAPARAWLEHYWPLLVSIVVPIAILTVHTDRSTVVAGIVLPSIGLLYVLALADLGGRAIPRTGAALLVLVFALALHARQHHQWRELESEKLADGRVAFAMHYEIGRRLLELGRTEPVYLSNTLEDAFEPGIAATALFERDRELIRPRSPARAAMIFPVAPERYRQILRSADVILLQTEGDRIRYPLVEYADSIGNEILAEASAAMAPAGSWRFSDAAATVYLRPLEADQGPRR